MSELRFYLSRFRRRFHWFLLVAATISLAAIAVTQSLPSSYRSELRLMMESKQIPDELARSTVATSAVEQMQIIEQRLMTRENLLRIASSHDAVRGQMDMSADEVAQAMRAQTRIRRHSGRNQATILTITFVAPEAAAAAGVLNAYLSVILEQNAEFRAERATTTQDFFEQQVSWLKRDLDAKSDEILAYKMEHAAALPETMAFRMSEQSRMREQSARLETDIVNLRNQRAQLIRLNAASRQIGADPNKAKIQLSPRQLRLSQLHQDLSEARTVYSDQSSKVRHLQALIAGLEADETQLAPVAEGEAPKDMSDSLMLDIQLADIDAQIAVSETQRGNLVAQIGELGDGISQTPANAIALEALERDYANILAQYNQAVDNLSRAETGERIEFMSRGQRIAVIEPPSVPSEPSEPNRRKLVTAGVGLGLMSGLALVYLLEIMSRSMRRPEDVIARFDVMPIATIPYQRTHGQLLAGRVFAVMIGLIVASGVLGASWAFHESYMPLDLVADKAMSRLGMSW
ncbi:hypothetical protein R3X27_00630 [Tropicimonas sp. TH_r6]|uniref:GumC family protein n=1 Tax=Tropicimonas sp. TH_r6 TaxID=3082085 RepID=UPI0029543AE3|nr:hypothetical protein [Tropicimonas sp. TH_r6]MDV7141176.1 hypothetical protein [Tropicimonas sp. TH_r6]